MNANSLRAGLALALLAAACAGPNPYRENRLVLERSFVDLQRGDCRSVVDGLEALLASTEADSEAYALQRFFATYLLTCAHQAAGSNGPFLEEPADRTRFQAVSSSSRDTQPSRTGHLMATTYHSSHGREWFAAADASPLELEGERLLPGGLESFGKQRALAFLNLSFLAVHAELKFQDRVEEILYGMPELTDLERCEEILKDLRFPEASRAWIYLAVFEHQKKRDEPNAYRFGVRAREVGRGIPAFDETLRAEIAHWIADESSYRFTSPAGQEFDPALEGCTVTGTPNLAYEATLRQP